LSANNNTAQNQYIIQEGDTLWEIANQYNTSVEELLNFNPEVDPDNLMIGQTLALPEQRPSQRGRRTTYDRRDRYRRYPPRPYYPGAWVCPRGAYRYYAQPGDTLYSIAARFGVSVDYIIDANPYINFNLPLQSGQLICLP
jgi:LysM repeat protein